MREIPRYNEIFVVGKQQARSTQSISQSIEHRQIINLSVNHRQSSRKLNERDSDFDFKKKLSINLTGTKNKVFAFLLSIG